MASNDVPSAGERVHFDKAVPDLVGEELGDKAQIWLEYERAARDDDRDRIGNWNRGLDNLALFAGLLSAVTTTFIIESQHDSQPDYARLTFLVLNATASGIPFAQEPFVIDSNVRLINCVWITSLMLSLAAALIAVVGKDWVAMYASRPGCNPRQWAEIRTYRLACINRWHMSGVLTSAPVLLHMSLILFFVGLVLFTSPDPVLQRVALWLAIAIGVLDLTTMLSAIIFPASPFKSPATQAVRRSLVPICTSLYDRLVYGPKQHLIQMLQQTVMLVVMAVHFWSMPSDTLPLQQPQRRMMRWGDVRVFWNHISSPRTWRNTAFLFARAPAEFALLLTALIRSVRHKYHYLRQRPRPRPWLSSVRSHLPHIDWDDRWAEARGQPTPHLLAQSLSHLNSMTQSTDVLHSILVALGDLPIGREVAHLLSLDLQAQLATEIEVKWSKADLLTLSRYILADQHLPDAPLIPSQVIYKFSGRTAVKSESIVFALVELDSGSFFPAEMMNQYFPDSLIQPRAVQHLLPTLQNYHIAILLAQHYWDHFATDDSLHLDRELRRLLVSWTWAGIEDEVDRRFGGTAGLLEVLVYSLDYLPTGIIPNACSLIFKVIGDGDHHATKHHCLVYAFGHDSPRISNAAWAAIPRYHPSAPPPHYSLIESALPLDQFVPSKGSKSATLPIPGDQLVTFKMCLARTVSMLLEPSRYFNNGARWMLIHHHGACFISTLELCVWYLETHLGRSRSALDSDKRLEIINLILKNSVLIRISGLWDFRSALDVTTTERSVINLLTTIARLVTALLASGKASDRDTGARLFRLYSSSETTDWEDKPVDWDLGSYLRTVAGRLSAQGRGMEVSMNRLTRVLHALRPLCMPRDDLRAAWERIQLEGDDEYLDSVWDAEDFELAPLLDPSVPALPVERAPSQGATSPPAVGEDSGATY